MLIEIQPGRQNTQWRYETGLFSSDLVLQHCGAIIKYPDTLIMTKHGVGTFNLILNIFLASRSIKNKKIDLKSKYSV